MFSVFVGKFSGNIVVKFGCKKNMLPISTPPATCLFGVRRRWVDTLLSKASRMTLYTIVKLILNAKMQSNFTSLAKATSKRLNAEKMAVLNNN